MRWRTDGWSRAEGTSRTRATLPPSRSLAFAPLGQSRPLTCRGQPARALLTAASTGPCEGHRAGTLDYPRLVRDIRHRHKGRSAAVGAARTTRYCPRIIGCSWHPPPALRGRLRRSPSACYRRDVLGQARPRVRAVRRSPRTVPVALPTAVPAAVPDASWIGMDQTVPVVLPRGGRRAGAATAPAPAGSYQHRVAVHTPSRRLDVPSRHRVGRTLRLAYERGRSGAGISSSASSLRAPLRRCA